MSTGNSISEKHVPNTMFSLSFNISKARKITTQLKTISLWKSVNKFINQDTIPACENFRVY